MGDSIISYSSDSSDRKGIVTSKSTVDELSPDIISLRPTGFKDYIGQHDTVETLKIAIQAAKMRNEPLEHILLHGPPGLGKTTVSHIIANEMGKNLTVTSGPTLIIKRSAAILNTIITDDGAKELSERSRGTPRIANRLLKRVRDYSLVKSHGKVTLESVKAALDLEGIDHLGLTTLDRNYLKTVIDFYKGGPVGIEAIAATLQEETDTLVDVVEPFLLKIGLVLRTSSGRKTSEKAFNHLKLYP